MQMVSNVISATLLVLALAGLAVLLLRDRRQILHALGLVPSLAPLPAPLPRSWR